jgi:aspartyl-tRNA(Asn)/glutamyl-tRNA(Gln) amidotransferase subunit B
MSWEIVVGLEVHVQLATRTKIFCACATAFGDRPNTNVCPVCLGLPGALPVTNVEAVQLATRAALALDFAVHTESVFARKNYFYPDLPKGYQISQFDRPLATGGRLDIAVEDGQRRAIGITRLHLEEDAGKSLHDRWPGVTAVDCNRAGVPLVEIVSDPDLRSPAEARRYLVALKQVLEYVEVSDCNMEEGHLRVDANLSVRRPGHPLGTKQEVKNMNSFAGVERALTQLAQQQIGTLEAGGLIHQETYSAATDQLRVMRAKEESHDYRYFPDPDLPPLVLDQRFLEKARSGLPELPSARRTRLMERYGLRPYDAEVLTATRIIADYFEGVVAAGAEAREAANWVMGPVMRHANEQGGALVVPPARLAHLIQLIGGGTVSAQAAKQVFQRMTESPDGDPASIAGELGLVQVGDTARIAQWVDDVVAANPDAAARYREGERKVLGFFMGEVMKRSGGRADPKGVQSVLRERLER